MGDRLNNTLELSMLNEKSKHSNQSIGFLIPEFPGQTHNFFWRERQALGELGIKTHLVSTQKPPKGIVSPSWARQAERETIYLYPVLIEDFSGIIGVLLKAGPLAWLNCIKVLLGALDLSVVQRAKLIAFIPLAAKLVVVARSQKWNHLHVHSCGNAANIALFASQLSNLTYSLTLHNPLAVYGGNQSQKWSHACFALVITKAIYDDVTNNIEANLLPKLFIAPMGVDTVKFLRSTPYRPYDGRGQLRLFSCARLNPGKGFNFLVLALSLLKKQSLDIQLVIAGEDDEGGTGYRANLEKQISDLGLDVNVTLLGAVSEEQVLAELENAHLFVLASLEEPLGVAIMEAMAMNVPTISTQAGGVPELILNETDGILVPPGDPDAFADAIHNLAEDKEKAIRISKASRMKIIQSFSHRRSAETIAYALSHLNLT